MEMIDRDLGWHRVDAELLERIRKRLADFESMTWDEILIRAKKQHHSIPVSEISSGAQRWLDSRRLLIDQVVSLRLTGKERIFGYLEAGVFVVLWWDPHHLVCPSQLRHT